jgi:hypothetical protein
MHLSASQCLSAHMKWTMDWIFMTFYIGGFTKFCQHISILVNTGQQQQQAHYMKTNICFWARKWPSNCIWRNPQESPVRGLPHTPPTQSRGVHISPSPHKGHWPQTPPSSLVPFAKVKDNILVNSPIR